MRRLSKDEVLCILRENPNRKSKLDLRETEILSACFDHEDFSRVDLSWGDFSHVSFENCCFDHAVLDHAKFSDVSFRGSSFRDASLFGTDFRECCLADTDFDGADFTASMLRGADLTGLRHTERTIHFRNHCPQEGYFFGYKKCFNNRLVKLLIPKDAKRCSATTSACRCDKAIVVAISDLDGSGSYSEAISFVDGNFIYKLGEMIYADGYNEDRWLESSNGIHFWLTEEEAIGYM
ncbi:MAG: pentapeptide repeat-containing protein [Johnsonella sp.]|nr:pentapeptide repeat-containing protein [Johnsonella sp.]